MDCSMCCGCRSLSRTSTMLAVLVASLVLSSVKVSSVKLSEQRCQPRPEVVQETKGYKPFHILLYRCSGTCHENIPPKQKPCTVSAKQEISLEVTDFSGRPKTITVYNHTSCNCECNLECKWDKGEVPDEENCLCKSGPSTEERRDEYGTADVLPYKIGIASMGFVTLIVVVFELIMCARRKEVLERVKKNCCKKEEHTDGKERKSNNSLNTPV